MTELWLGIKRVAGIKTLGLRGVAGLGLRGKVRRREKKETGLEKEAGLRRGDGEGAGLEKGGAGKRGWRRGGAGEGRGLKGRSLERESWRAERRDGSRAARRFRGGMGQLWLIGNRKAGKVGS